MASRVWHFGNCSLALGYLTHMDAWGLAFSWDLIESQSVFLYDVYRKHFICAVAYQDLVEGSFFQWWPLSWEWVEGEILSAPWTGRTHILRRVAWPMIRYWRSHA